MTHPLRNSLRSLLDLFAAWDVCILAVAVIILLVVA